MEVPGNRIEAVDGHKALDPQGAEKISLHLCDRLHSIERGLRALHLRAADVRPGVAGGDTDADAQDRDNLGRFSILRRVVEHQRAHERVDLLAIRLYHESDAEQLQPLKDEAPLPHGRSRGPIVNTAKSGVVTRPYTTCLRIAPSRAFDRVAHRDRALVDHPRVNAAVPGVALLVAAVDIAVAK